MRYRIGLTQQVFEEATIEVDAANSDEAEAKAHALADAGGIEWRFLETNQNTGVEIVSCDEITERAQS